MVVCGAGFLAYTNLSIEQFRIFGFSQRSLIYPLLARIDLFEQNFLIQFAYSPVFGNLRVDDLTTGSGSFAHSLISILSHLGIVGGTLFCLYISSLYRELKKAPPFSAWFYTDSDLGVFRIILGLLILGYALVGTFFTWMPLWFSLGLLYPPMLLHRAPVATVIRHRLAASH